MRAPLPRWGKAPAPGLGPAPRRTQTLALGLATQGRGAETTKSAIGDAGRVLLRLETACETGGGGRSNTTSLPLRRGYMSKAPADLTWPRHAFLPLSGRRSGFCVSVLMPARVTTIR